MTTRPATKDRYSPAIGGADLVARMKQAYARRVQSQHSIQPQRYAKLEERVQSIAKGGDWRPYEEIKREAGLTPATSEPTRYAQPWSDSVAMPPQMQTALVDRIKQRAEYNAKIGRYQKFDTIKHEILAGR